MISVLVAAALVALLTGGLTRLRRDLRNTRHEDQAIGLTIPPSGGETVGWAKPPAPGPRHPRPAPGPRLLYTTKAWDDGTIRIWDGHGVLTWEHRDGLADYDLERLIRDLRN